jgi:predicted nucleotidyltransferase component of viral defense system
MAVNFKCFRKKAHAMEGSFLITKEQLMMTARHFGVNPYYLEKEYLQTVFLYSLYSKQKNFIFKGGTCLKIAYNHARFSEDLDFNTDASPEQIQKAVRQALKMFEILGIDFSFAKEELFQESYTAKICFQGPLYVGKKHSENSIRLDVGKKGRIYLEPKWVQVFPKFPDIPVFFVLAMDEQEILAEKIRSIVMRAKPRDFFDVYSLLNKGIKIRKDLVNKKSMEVKVSLVKPKLCAKKAYENELAQLLVLLPPYEDVVVKVKEKLEGIIKR